MDDNVGSSPSGNLEPEVLWQCSQAVDLKSVLRKRDSRGDRNKARSQSTHWLGNSPDSPIDVDVDSSEEGTMFSVPSASSANRIQRLNLDSLNPSNPSTSFQGPAGTDGSTELSHPRRCSTHKSISRTRRSRQTLSPSPSQPSAISLSQNSGAGLHSMIRRFGSAMRERVKLKEESHLSQGSNSMRLDTTGSLGKVASADYVSRLRERRLVDKTNNQPYQTAVGSNRAPALNPTELGRSKDALTNVGALSSSAPAGEQGPLPRTNRLPFRRTATFQSEIPFSSPKVSKNYHSQRSLSQPAIQGGPASPSPYYTPRQPLSSIPQSRPAGAVESPQDSASAPSPSQLPSSQSSRRLGMKKAMLSQPASKGLEAANLESPTSATVLSDTTSKPRLKSLGMRVNGKSYGNGVNGSRGFKVPFRTTESTDKGLSPPEAINPTMHLVSQQRQSVTSGESGHGRDEIATSGMLMDPMDDTAEDEPTPNAGDSSFSSFECDLEELDAVMEEYDAA